MSSPLDFDVTQDVYYAFGEVNVPLISPDMQLTGIRKLSATAAVRYESYSGLESLATPKFGINYVPVDGLEIKATWGKAFKAATLYQRYNNQIAVVRLATTRGGVGYPAGSTVLDISGGQPDLKAERAETWTASIAATPATLPGLRLEADVFSIRYKNRIATPIAVPGQSLSNPAYASLVTLDPSAAQLAAATSACLLAAAARTELVCVLAPGPAPRATGNDTRSRAMGSLARPARPPAPINLVAERCARESMIPCR